MSSALQSLESLELKVSCDWYDAGVPDGNFKFIVEGLCEALNTQPRAAIAKGGYETCVQLFDSNEGVQSSRAMIMVDHPMSPGRVRVSANGPSGGPAREFLLKEGINHEVSRYDSAVDVMMSDRSFARRSGQMVRFCTEQKKHYHPQGTVENGRTYEFNRRIKDGTTSVHQKQPEATVVFYEKGKQLGLADFRDWKRAELRLRPQKEEARRAAAFMEPLDLWGSFKWTTTMLEIASAGCLQVPDAAYPRFRMSLPEVEEKMRLIRAMKTFEHMGSQYGRTYDTLADLVGEEEADRLALAFLKRQREVIKNFNAKEMYQSMFAQKLH